jgi:hypothetical protein
VIDTQRAATAPGQPVFTHADPEAFEATVSLADGIHTILAGGTAVELLVRAVPGAPIIIVFSGDIDRARHPDLPVFAGLAITQGLPATLISIADPSLSLSPDLGLGWYAGSAGLKLQALVPRIVAHLAKVLHATGMVFLGGSGGGFASLYYAVRFPASLSIVWNPQTDIRRYWRRHVARYGQSCFGYDDVGAFIEAMPQLIHCDLRRRFARRYRGNAIIYLQNKSDAHVGRQAAPFLKALRPGDPLDWSQDQNLNAWEKLWLFLANWGEGHARPPRESLHALLATLVARPGDWARLIRDGGMRDILADAFNKG